MEDACLLPVHGSGGLLITHRGHKLPCAAFHHFIERLLDLVLCFFQLTGSEFLRYGL